MVSPSDILQVGFAEFFSNPLLLGLVVFGVVYGITFGVIPGVSNLEGMLVLIPLAFTMPIIPSLVLFTSVYCGGTFGGAFSAILLNIPGAPENIPTAFDGYPMHQQGLAGKAMGATITCSAIGGLVGALSFIFFAPYLANFALGFSDADYFGIVAVGLLVVGSVSGRSISRGLISVAIGILVGCIGLTHKTGEERFMFDSTTLAAGINYIAIIVGAFALSEIFLQFSRVLKTKTKRTIGKYSRSKFNLRELWQQKFNVARSSLLGTLIGFIPGIGSIFAAFASYGLAKSVSRTPGKFGTGILDGVVAPETANNAATGGALIPLFTLGIPGGACAAVMLAVFLSQGLHPGPMVFFKQLPLVGAIMVALLITNFLLIPCGRYGVALIVKMLRLDLVYLVIVVAVFCAVGTFSLRNMMFDPYCAVIAGVVGYYWKVHDFPITPFILGLVLGPMAESRFANAMIQEGSIIGVLSSPIALAFLLGGLIFVIPPIVGRIKAKKSQPLQGEEESPPRLGSLLLYIMLIGTGIYFWYLTNSFMVTLGRVGAAAWPRIALGIMISMSLIGIWQWFNKYKRAKKTGLSVDVSLWKFLVPEGWYVFIPMLLFGSYYLLIDIVGYVLLTLISSLIILYVGGIRKPLTVISFSVTLAVIVSFLFIGFMQLYMPEGVSIFADIHHQLYEVLFRIF